MSASERCQVRIIAGQWRGRRIHFPNTEQLRPTPDKVRETLFNWLNPVIAGAHCLDCFAGSGILGFEALSRGAASVVGVESHRKTAAMLSENAEKLQTTHFQVITARFPKQCPADLFTRAYDIVFIDPPFFQGWAETSCQWLEDKRCFAPEAWIYVEVEKRLQWQPPLNWVLHRQTQCGEGQAFLFKRNEEQDHVG